MKAKKGFTLVEILIVVVILGILAAIVIPQFTNASTEAKEASLRADLQTLRSQIELYKIQHDDSLPDTSSSANFTSDLTAQDANGFGPYMNAVPTNPFNNLSSFEFVTSDPNIGDGSSGWIVNSNSGKVWADTDDPNYFGY